jgi:5-methylthioadenosine/S-adenosylhomocysteine deaminase
VYASKSSDVSDVMVNGKWLMRAHELLTLNEGKLLAQANEIAHQIDAFLIKREQSVLRKLIALGGSMEQESFELQVKVKLEDRSVVLSNIRKSEITITAFKHYRQFDNYFSFEDPAQGHLRFREDELIDAKGNVANVRSRLTLLGPREDKFERDVLLSRSRFLAPAVHTLRFYREYFKPAGEEVIQKDRLRWHIKYKNTEFFVNLDTMEKPDLGQFVEIKSRTWSRKDAVHKAELALELLALLGATGGESMSQDYIEVIGEQ